MSDRPMYIHARARVIPFGGAASHLFGGCRDDVTRRSWLVRRRRRAFVGLKLVEIERHALRLHRIVHLYRGVDPSLYFRHAIVVP